MGTKAEQKQKLALVFGTLPTVEEIDQFRLLPQAMEITVISSEAICGYLTQTSRFQNLTCLALPDHNENPTYLPGLEKVLSGFDIVVIKERIGLYAYQAVKAKWRYRFRLAVWVDNLSTFPAEDVSQMRTIRREVTNAADLFLVQSQHARAALKLEGIEEQRIVDFLPWIEKRSKRTKKTRAQAIEKLGLAESNYIIVHIGQIEWEEGLFDLASGIKLLCEEQPSLSDRIKIIFCGIGTLAPALREMLFALKIDDKAIYLAPNRESIDTLLAAADCIYVASVPSRDRIDGEPYRLLTAMAHEIPIIANRTPIVEEYCGKHRFDFCVGSPDSVAKAVKKSIEAQAIRHDIVSKNLSTADEKYNESAVKISMEQFIDSLYKKVPTVDLSALDLQVAEVESLVHSKQYLAAIDLIESIFKLKEIPLHHSANLYRFIGDCFAKLGDSESAKNAYIKAIEIDPYSAKSYIGLGTVGLIKGSNDIAVIHFQKAVSLAPDDEMANLGLGLAFQGMDELKEAMKWVVKALEVNPDNTAAMYTLVRISYDLQKFEQAEQALKRYIHLHPHDHNMVYTLAGMLFKLERHKEVMELTQQIINIDPLDSRALSLNKQAKRALEQSNAESSVG